MNKSNVKEIESFMENMKMRKMLIEALELVKNTHSMTDDIDLIMEIEDHRAELNGMLELVNESIRNLE